MADPRMADRIAGEERLDWLEPQNRVWRPEIVAADARGIARATGTPPMGGSDDGASDRDDAAVRWYGRARQRASLDDSHRPGAGPTQE